LQKKRSPNQTTLATKNFSKTDSVAHSALFHKLLAPGLPSCLSAVSCPSCQTEEQRPFTMVFALLSDRKDVTCDRTFIFGSHIRSLCNKFFPVLKFSARLPLQGITHQFYKAFICPVLSHAVPEWFPFLCKTLRYRYMKVYHRSACRLLNNIWLSFFHSHLTAAVLID